MPCRRRPSMWRMDVPGPGFGRRLVPHWPRTQFVLWNTLALGALPLFPRPCTHVSFQLVLVLSCTCHGKHRRVPGHLDARSEVGGSLVSTCPTSLFPLPYLSPPPPFLILASLSLPHLIPSSSTFGHCRCLGLLVYATLCIISPTKRPLISVDIYPYTPVCNLSCHYPIRRPSSTFGSPVPLNAVPILCGQRQRRRRRRPPHTHAPPPGP